MYQVFSTASAGFASQDLDDAVETRNNFQAGKHKEAVTEYEKAYPTLSGHVTLKFALALAYYGAGKLKKAIVLLDEAYKPIPPTRRMRSSGQPAARRRTARARARRSLTRFRPVRST
jgi:tetratricopeptide (TPR) repeat protein